MRHFTADDGRPAVSRVEAVHTGKGRDLTMTETLFLSPALGRPLVDGDEGEAVRVREWSVPAQPPELDPAARDALSAYLGQALPKWGQGLKEAEKEVLGRCLRLALGGKGPAPPEGWEKAVSTPPPPPHNTLIAPSGTPIAADKARRRGLLRVWSNRDEWLWQVRRGRKTWERLHIDAVRVRAAKGEGAAAVIKGLEALESCCLAQMGAIGEGASAAEGQEREDGRLLKMAEDAVKHKMGQEALRGSRGWAEGQDEAGRKLEAAVVHRRTRQHDLDLARRTVVEADDEDDETLFARTSFANERTKVAPPGRPVALVFGACCF